MDPDTSTEESPFMRPEFVLSDEPIEPPLHTQQHVPLHRHCSCCSDHSRTIASDGGGSRHGSPSRKLPRQRLPTEEKNNGTKAADLPDDVRKQVHSLLAGDDDPAQATTGRSRSLRPLTGEPTRLSAQPTVEEIQMCFAQIDLAILMETKPPPALHRFTSPNANDQRASAPPAQPRVRPASANRDHVPPEHGHQICARRAFGSPPRLLIPQPPTSDSDTSSIDIQPDVMTKVYRAATASPHQLHTMNYAVDEAANPPISHMQQLLIERANMRRKSSAAAAVRNSNSSQPLASRSSRASSPATAVTLPVSPSSMQQQLIQRANMRRSLQANMTQTATDNHSQSDAAARRSVEKAQFDQAQRAFTSPSRCNSSADKRGSSPERYDEAQTTLSSVRDDFLKKLQQIQELAETGRRGYGDEEEEEEQGQESSSTSEREKKARAYQNPIWTHRSCSSSSLNGSRYRTQEEDNLCLDSSTDVESQQ